MTCIVGMVKDGKVTIGGDSAGVNGLNITIRKDPKVFINGEFVIGCTSSFRMIELLQFSLKVPKRKAEQDVYEYMCTDFVDAVRNCFKDGGYLQKAKDGDDQGGVFLVGYQGRLFRVEGDFQVGESADPFQSVGCGEDFALGSLCTNENRMDMTVEQKITKALEIATRCNGGVRPPYVLKTL